MYTFNNKSVLLFICALSAIVSCNQKKNDIYYNADIGNIIKLAQDREKSFCVVLYEDSSSISISYFEKLEKSMPKKFPGSIFNIINISLPENKWYAQWLGVDNKVVTCVFSSSGILRSIITGASSYTFDCIDKSLKNDLSCNEFGYSPLFNIADNINKMETLNKILRCKIDFDHGKDIEIDINETLDVLQYPYNLYLKCLNSKEHGRDEQAIYIAKQLLTFDDIPYLKMYSDLYEQVKYIDPNYNPDNGAILLIIEKNINLINCIKNQTKNFKIKLINKGESMLIINRIELGCSCIKLLESNMSHNVDPRDSIIVDFEFTPDVSGTLEREIIFTSNANNRLEEVKIKAFVE